jgi:hypothetical protein
MYIIYTGNTPSDNNDSPSTPPLIEDDSDNSSDSEDEVDVVGNKLGLADYCDQKRREVY